METEIIVHVTGRYETSHYSIEEAKKKFCGSVASILTKQGYYYMVQCNSCEEKCSMYDLLDEKKSY